MRPLTGLFNLKSIIATIFIMVMVCVLADSIFLHHNPLDQQLIELNDIDAEKEAEKGESEKKEKEADEKEYLIVNIKKRDLDYIRIAALYKSYNSLWCNPELDIITPPPEEIG